MIIGVYIFRITLRLQSPNHEKKLYRKLATLILFFGVQLGLLDSKAAAYLTEEKWIRLKVVLREAPELPFPILEESGSAGTDSVCTGMGVQTSSHLNLCICLITLDSCRDSAGLCAQGAFPSQTERRTVGSSIARIIRNRWPLGGWLGWAGLAGLGWLACR